jgi:2-polyprenyl-6-methoxyphenol hydroxylase-like FAD-dependent oxidoreductase
LPNGRTYWYFETSARHVDESAPLARIDRSQWPDPFGDVVAATDQRDVLVHPVRTLAPLRTWSRGQVTLLGDAAHAMAPNLGQGAAQAIEDAAALHAALRSTAEIAPALLAYESARESRARMVQRESARMARLAFARPAHARDLLMRAMPDSVRRRALERLVA